MVRFGIQEEHRAGLLGMCRAVGPEFGVPGSGRVQSLDGVRTESGRRRSTEGKDFSEAISNTLRPPAVVLNFQRHKRSDLTGVWG